MKKISITQIKSSIGTPGRHKEVVKCLGLRRIGHTVVRNDTPEIRGMVHKVRHLLKVKEGAQ